MELRQGIGLYPRDGVWVRVTSDGKLIGEAAANRRVTAIDLAVHPPFDLSKLRCRTIGCIAEWFYDGLPVGRLTTGVPDIQFDMTYGGIVSAPDLPLVDDRTPGLCVPIK